jgi:hypothetical protein
MPGGASCGRTPASIVPERQDALLRLAWRDWGLGCRPDLHGSGRSNREVATLPPHDSEVAFPRTTPAARSAKTHHVKHRSDLATGSPVRFCVCIPTRGTNACHRCNSLIAHVLCRAKSRLAHRLRLPQTVEMSTSPMNEVLVPTPHARRTHPGTSMHRVFWA